MDLGQTASPLALRPHDVAQLRQWLETSRHIVIIPHTAPDGDAVGSTLGLCGLIRQIAPEASCQVLSPDTIERYLLWIEGSQEVEVWTRDEAQGQALIAQADLLLHLDHNQVHRVRHESYIAALEASPARRVLIDHHLYPDEGFDLVLSYPQLGSTCELVYMLIKAMGYAHHITPQIATTLLSGIITDTGRLMYGCFYPEVFAHFAELLALGADYAHIIDSLSYHNSLSQLRLQGYALHEKLELHPELRTATISLSAEEMTRLGVSKGDTEGLANMPLSVEGIDSACLIREDGDQIKLSMRSVGQVAVNQVAMRGFGGGGHLNAAGGELKGGTLEEAKNTYLREMKALLEGK